MDEQNQEKYHRRITMISDNPIKNYSTVPSVVVKTANGERGYDIFSRILEDRVIMLCDEVNHDTAQIIIAELLYLASVDPDKDITMYINSPGGSVADGLAIYDTMNFIKPDVSTVCMGTAASMGAFLLAGGAKGKRYILPNAEVMIHQPLGGMQGQATEMEIAMKHMARIKEKLTKYLAANTGKSYDEVLKDTDRDNWLSAEEAVQYGLVDKIITNTP
jgi:ATP-dependent Clp protease protease subunit